MFFSYQMPKGRCPTCGKCLDCGSPDTVGPFPTYPSYTTTTTDTWPNIEGVNDSTDDQSVSDKAE